MFVKASSLVSPWLIQPGNSRTQAENPPTLSLLSITVNLRPSTVAFFNRPHPLQWKAISLFNLSSYVLCQVHLIWSERVFILGFVFAGQLDYLKGEAKITPDYEKVLRSRINTKLETLSNETIPLLMKNEYTRPWISSLKSDLEERVTENCYQVTEFSNLRKVSPLPSIKRSDNETEIRPTVLELN